MLTVAGEILFVWVRLEFCSILNLIPFNWSIFVLVRPDSIVLTLWYETS